MEFICPSAAELQTDCEHDIPCPIAGCGKILPHRSSLRFHVVKVHRIVTSESDRCIAEKCPVGSLNNAASSASVVRFLCPVNGCVYSASGQKQFTTHKLLKQHYMKVHADKRHQCTLCTASFGLQRDMRRHEKSCHRHVACVTCGVSFSTEADLTRHLTATRHGTVAADSALTSVHGAEVTSDTVAPALDADNNVALPQHETTSSEIEIASQVNDATSGPSERSCLSSQTGGNSVNSEQFTDTWQPTTTDIVDSIDVLLSCDNVTITTNMATQSQAGNGICVVGKVTTGVTPSGNPVVIVPEIPNPITIGMSTKSISIPEKLAAGEKTTANSKHTLPETSNSIPPLPSPEKPTCADPKKFLPVWKSNHKSNTVSCDVSSRMLLPKNVLLLPVFVPSPLAVAVFVAPSSCAGTTGKLQEIAAKPSQACSRAGSASATKIMKDVATKAGSALRLSSWHGAVHLTSEAGPSSLVDGGRVVMEPSQQQPRAMSSVGTQTTVQPVAIARTNKRRTATGTQTILVTKESKDSQMSPRVRAKRSRDVQHSHTQTHGSHSKLRRVVSQPTTNTTSPTLQPSTVTTFTATQTVSLPFEHQTSEYTWPDVASNATQTTNPDPPLPPHPPSGIVESIRTQTVESFLSSTSQKDLLDIASQLFTFDVNLGSYDGQQHLQSSRKSPSISPPTGLHGNDPLLPGPSRSTSARESPSGFGISLSTQFCDAGTSYDYNSLDDFVSSVVLPTSPSSSSDAVPASESLSRIMLTSSVQTMPNFDAASTQTMDFDDFGGEIVDDLDFIHTETQTMDQDLLSNYFNFTDIETQTAAELELWDSQTQTCFDSLFD